MQRQFLNPLSVILVVVLFAAQLFIVPTTAEAKWTDRSDELPGDDFPTGTVIVAAVAVGIVVGYIIYKHSKKSDSDEEGDVEVEDASESSESSYLEGSPESIREYPSECHLVPVVTEQPTLGFYLNVTDDSQLYGPGESATDFSDVTLRAGFSIDF